MSTKETNNNILTIVFGIFLILFLTFCCFLFSYLDYNKKNNKFQNNNMNLFELIEYKETINDSFLL